MRKTALNQLLDHLNDVTIIHCKATTMDKITELLETEKQQIVDSFWIGVHAEAGDNSYMNGEDYYSKVFQK